MKKLLRSAFVVLLVASGHSLSASASESAASNMGNANSPQQVDQASAQQTSHQKMGRRMHSHHHCGMHKKVTEMDTNKDGMISKEEFMTFHEKMFDGMKQTDGLVNVQEFEKHMHEGMKHEHMRKATEDKNIDNLHPEDNKKF